MQTYLLLELKGFTIKQNDQSEQSHRGHKFEKSAVRKYWNFPLLMELCWSFCFCICSKAFFLRCGCAGLPLADFAPFWQKVETAATAFTPPQNQHAFKFTRFRRIWYKLLLIFWCSQLHSIIIKHTTSPVSNKIHENPTTACRKTNNNYSSKSFNNNNNLMMGLVHEVLVHVEAS